MDNFSRAEAPGIQEDVIDLRHYWRVLMLQKWNIAALCVVVGLLAAFIAFSLQPVYKATNTLLIESKQANVLSIEDVYGIDTGGKEYFLTQFEILKSRELAVRVVKRLKLDVHPLFDPRQQKKTFDWKKYIPIDFAEPEERTADELFDAVVETFIDGLSIEPVRKTQLVKINYESFDSALAADIANALADVYIESHLEAKLSVTRKAADWLGDRIGDLRSNLQESERNLQNYREKEQLVDVDGVRTLDADELKELTQNLVEARNLRAKLETIASQAKSLGGGAKVEQLLEMSSVLEHPLVQTLKQEQAKADLRVAELSKRYGPGHPKMQSAKSELNTANQELSRQVSRVVSGIKDDYKNAINTEKNLERQVAKLKGRLQGVNRKEFKLKEYEREVETNRHLYNLFLSRSKETDEAGGLESAHARVIDPAVITRVPIKPKKSLIVLLAVVVSGIVGVALAFLQDSLNNTVRTPDDVEGKLRAAMLGFLPLVKNNKSTNAFEGFISDSKGNFAEAIRTIRTGLMLSSLDEPHKITLITSSVPNEGKSTVSLNLAEAIGQMERVLLIDADMRRPTLAKTMGLPRSSLGLSNLVVGTATLKECVRSIEGSTVDVITSGVVPANPLELLSSKRFGGVLQKLGEHYDRIIIDSAPTHAVSDSLVLSSYADAVVYVVKADETPASLAVKGLQRLREVGAPITGVVLNKVDVDKNSRYGSYYAGYYQGYGYSSDDEDESHQKQV
jgi:capsular exopolysaccharide synthesis family protein